MHKQLTELGACSEGARFAAGFATLQEAWDACERPDWMMWLVGRSKTDPKVSVRLAVIFAKSVLKYVQKGEDRPRLAIETVERWLDGKATLQEVNDAACAAAYAADATADAAADAAFRAAYAADAAAYAAARAADAADAAILALTHAVADAAYATARKEQCDEIRKLIPTVPVE